VADETGVSIRTGTSNEDLLARVVILEDSPEEGGNGEIQIRVNVRREKKCLTRQARSNKKARHEALLMTASYCLFQKKRRS
jgi:hypothetical protein